MPSFFAVSFAVAGLAVAAGPLAIHLLNRRRARVVEWAAMELLREAIGQQRRPLRLRDVTLLSLRTTCVLSFALAMARPYWSRAAGPVDLDQPVHAVLMIDNSLSMGYQRLGGTLLDAAKSRARVFLDSLPPGSRAHVLPLCGNNDEIVWEPYRDLADATRFLERIEVVDQAASAAAAVLLAAKACGAAGELPRKRVVLIGDQQAINWPVDTAGSLGAELPDIQIVQVAVESPENAWIAAFEWQGGLADAETTGIFLVTVGYEGEQPRSNVPVTLSVEGNLIAEQVIDLEAGQTRELVFPHQWTPSAEPGEPSFVTATVKLSPDRLPDDDVRVLVVPVVSAAPVLFVDNLGADEDPAANRYGETFRLRRLLEPTSEHTDRRQGLARIQRAKIDELTSETLAASELVVVAGVEQPGEMVPLLRRYVEGGGQLLMAAGGRFDPAAWNTAAWLDGDGILPAPLRAELLGIKRPGLKRSGLKRPGQELPLWLDTATMNHDDFRMGPMSPREFAELYHAALFFRIVMVDDGDPGFGRWAASLPPRFRPRTPARFSNGRPFLIERDIGRGTVLFAASGISPEWNTLSDTHAVALYDRIARSMLARRLPRRNLDPRERHVLAVDGVARLDRHLLLRPDGRREELAVEALGDGTFGVTVRDLWRRGLYRISTATDENAPARSQRDVSLAVNGPARESRLRCLAPAEMRAKLAAAGTRVLARHEPISLAGSRVSAEDAWKWFMCGALGLHLAELVCAGTLRGPTA
ncbi:MAG TPA: BatA domain-containing protein [Pirellulales bacterium]|nr:BatA domain-containing protein [Pirellulales bacterium]